MKQTADLNWHFHNRHEAARGHAEAGQPVIGIIGADVPRELILAVGALPLRLHAGAAATTDVAAPRSQGYKRAAQLLGATEASAVELLGRILDGELNFLTAIVVSRDRDSSLRTYQILRELTKTDDRLPKVHLIDLLHLPRRATEKYNIGQVARLAEELCRYGKQAIDVETLRESIESASEVRRRLLNAHDARIDGKLKGSTVLQLFAVAEALAPVDALDLINSALAESAAVEPAQRTRVFLSGSAQETDELYVQLEMAGCQVVGEDHHRGLLATTIFVDQTGATTVEKLLASVAVAYGQRGPDGATSSATAKAQYSFSEALAANASAIISWVHEHDEAPRWDFPKLRDAGIEQGIPVLLCVNETAEPETVHALLQRLAQLSQETAR